MEQIKDNAGEDDAATDKDESSDVEAKTPTGSLFGRSVSCSTITQDAASASPPQERRKSAPERQLQQPLKGLPGTMAKIRTKDSFTAWDKKPASRGGRSRSIRPPKFSRLLSSLSESDEQLVSQASEPELPKEVSEDLIPRPPLQEQLTDQGIVPVNFTALSLQDPEEIPAVETVETKPQGLMDQVPSTSSDAEIMTDQSTSSLIEPKKEDSSFVPLRRDATIHSVHSQILLASDSVPSVTGMSSSIWSMGQKITHWRMANQRGYHIDQLTQDKVLKSTILKHERDTKIAVPLPLQEVIEEEALEILKDTLKAYQRHLGTNHHLTLQMEEQAEKLHLRLKGRGVID
ncbi:cation channel sperm-associated auxiliary subunit zeta [Paroedura picta]|uniref:cation channel sperm-associated auxiliary subunit zeta n=1 Tax=Paroedura picta TaxID=143630 RepID=UPI0040566ED9